MNQQRLLILLVEDDPAHVEAVRRAIDMTDLQWEIELARSLREARSAIAARPPDLVLADLNLIDGKAFDLLSGADDSRPYPVLVMTSQGDEQMAVRAMKGGALDYVVKSEETFWEMPKLLHRAVREWRHVQQRRQAERALRESEASLRSIIDNTPNVAMQGYDIRGRILFWNNASERLFGWREEEARGKTLDQLILTRDEAERFRRTLERIAGSGEPIGPLECDVRHRDGGRVRCESTRFEIRPFDGERVFIRMDVDITERVRAEEKLVRAYGESRAITRAVRDALYMIDPRGRLLWWNKRVEEITGRTPEALRGHPYAEFLVPADAPKLETALRDVLRQGYAEVEVQVASPTGPLPYQFNGVCVRNEQGAIIGVAGVGRDISEQLRTQARLRLSATVLENTRDGVMITDAERLLVAVNSAFTEITGYTEQEVQGKRPTLLLSGRHDRSFYRAMWQSIRETGHWQGEVWNRRKDGEVYPQWLSISTVRNAAGEVTNYVGVFSDISRIKRSEEQLEHLAHYDPLTDLPNRLLLTSRLHHAIDQARLHAHKVGVLFADLDRFKNVNDSLGHPAGDELLQAIALRIRTRIRSDDTLARLGGDEFVVIMEAIHRPEEAATVAEAVIALLDAPFRLAGGRDVYVGASIGISLYPDNGEDATELVRNADTAMYQAKSHGRNTFRFYAESLTLAAKERLDLESRLRKAVERGQLLLHYQPQVSLRNDGVIGVEALVRWQPAPGELVVPDRFIPLAEETGLIVPIGAWVLQRACRQVREWMHTGIPRVNLAVNLSPRQFAHPGLVAQVAAILAETGLPGEVLELELTESALMDQGARAVATLQALKDLGISISIDDFGTGYSSLAYLKRLPIDKLKIDRSFVQGIPEDRSDVEIVATIISMASRLQMHVLAEGVETEDQHAFLRARGCDAYQGFLFSRPLPPGEIRRLFT
jgi:diguanylate cyclase (GGDEF)-like protein/PAS domain S-box-containing protein